MPEHVLIVAIGFFQGIGKDRKASGVKFTGRQGTFFIGGFGKVGHGGGEPSRVDREGVKGVAENAADPVAIAFGLPRDGVGE
jgi:hypothetical protein